MRRTSSLIISVALLLMWLGCQSTPSTQSSDQQGSTPAATSPASSTRATTRPGEKASSAATPAESAAATIPAGEHIVIRLGNTLSSKGSNTGDTFSGTVAQPISSNGKVIVPEGSEASGTVADAKALGRFKGGALLSVVLNSITVNGKTYKVETAAVSHTLKGKGKRSAVAIGGGAGLGALIGGLAGGGKGAAIGVAAGAGAGTAGAAFTGNKEIVLPAETAVSFKLLQPVEIR
jgi:hypothetical protein